MMMLLNNEFYAVIPMPAPEGDFEIRYNKDKNRLEAYKGGKRIDIGVIWHSFNKSITIHAKTGEIKRNTPGIAKIRANFGNFHQDFEIE